MNKFEGSTFDGGTVTLDNNNFNKCKFRNCIIQYGGAGPVGLSNCEFSNVKWVFHGAANNTLNFMQAMYTGMGEGGKQIIEQTFENIKSGKKNILSEQ